MKIAVCLVLLSVVSFIKAETCNHGDASLCSHVTCPENDYTLDCHNGQCTCSHNTATCSLASDCTGIQNCPQIFGKHCIDGRCRCGFGIGGVGK